MLQKSANHIVRKAGSLLLSAVLAVGMIPAMALGAEAKAQFPDLRDGGWYLEQGGAFSDDTLFIKYAVDNGLMGGYKDSSGNVTGFGSNDGISRAQMAKIISVTVRDVLGAR